MSINTTAAINARFAAINFTYEANTDGYIITNLSTGKTKQFNTFFLADIISGLEQVIENRKEQVAYEAEQARLAVMAEKQVEYGIALPQGEPVAEAEVVETVAIETANLTNFDIVTLAENNGFRVSLQPSGEWLLIRKEDRMVTNIGYNLRDAVAIINPATETMSQVEIERGVAAQEAEEHAAWVAEQEQEEVNVIEDDDTMTVGMAAMVLNDKRCGLATEEEIDEAQGVMVRAVAAELRARGVMFADDSLQDWICAVEFRGFETAESLADEWMSYDEEEIDPDEARRMVQYQYDAWSAPAAPEPTGAAAMTIDATSFVRRFEVAVVTEEINNAFYRWRYSVPVTERDVQMFLDIYCDGTETIDQILKIWLNPPPMAAADYWEAVDRWVEEHPE